MASKRRLNRQKCTGKRSYPKLETAIHFAGRTRTDTNLQFAYRCDRCGQYHCGRPSNEILVKKGLMTDYGHK